MADFNLGRIRFVWKGAWQASTSYVRDDVVSYGGSSYVCTSAHTSTANWADNSAKFDLMAEGSTTTTTTGDLIYRDASGETRLPIGSTGQALFVGSNGEPTWAGIEEAEATYYVTSGGSDTNNGQTLNSAFKTIKHAVDNVTGPANIFVKTGTFYEQLPLDIPAGVALVGDGQRTTNIQPIYIVATGATVVAASNATSTTVIVQDSQTTGNEWQVGAVVTGTSITGTVTISGIATDTPTAGFTTLTISHSQQTVSAETVTLTSDYRTQTMFRMGDSSMLHKVLMSGLTGFAPNLADPEDITAATVQGVFVALDPSSPITNKSPYVIECSCHSTGGVGAVVDGTVHGSGNKSIVFHAYTMINDDGVGLWVNGDGKVEAVSCFTYYCWYGYTTTNGGKIRSLVGNNSYGTYGAVSRGYNASETALTGALYGEQLAIEGISGTFGVGNTITGAPSGATGVITNVQNDKVYYTSSSGTFAVGDTITDGGSNATATISTDGVTGQQGFILIADGFSAEPEPGSSVTIAGDAQSYVIQSVSGTYVNTSSVMTILLANEKVTASADNVAITIRQEFSQTRLTGHDFLNVGTGSKSDTNYPGIPNQNPSQANEVIEEFPGRVFYVSTDQDGNFRVGDYFKVDQATGRATLNASAFDLSGLTSLRLGAIGAQLGELVDEFSSDSTLSGNSNTAVPTEAATRGYFTQVATNVVPVSDNNLTLGTPSKRWQEVYVGPGSVNIGNLKITETAGAFKVTQSDGATPAAIASDEFDTGSIRYFQNNIIGTNSNENIEITASGTGDINLNSDVSVSGTLYGPSTFTIDPAAHGDNTGTVVVAGNITTTGTLYGPSTFTIDPATHGDNTGTVVIAGNLQIDGTTTTVNSTTMTVDDKNIVLASGAANSSAADGAGISVDGASATITYNSTGDEWAFNKTVVVADVETDTINEKTAAAGVTIDGVVLKDGGATVTADVNFGDNDKAIFGAGSDLQIYHDGSDSWVEDNGTGNLYIDTNGAGVNITYNNSAENMASFTANGAAALYYDGSPKLATTSTGVNITGKVQADSLQLDGATSGTITISAPATAGTQTYTLPTSTGSNGQALITNGSGTLSWGAAGATLSDDTSTTTLYPAMSTSTSGSFTTAKVSSTKYTFNASTGVLTTSGGFVESSSIALKENVNPITNALDSILNLVGVTYDRKDGSKTNEAGLIAEEVAEVLPNIVTDNKDGIYYSKLTAYLVEAVKSLKAEIDPLKEEIRRLKGE